MNIAIDISPLQTGHSIRGTGFYLTYLKEALLKYYPRNTYHFFSGKEKLSITPDIVHYPYFDPFFLTLPLRKVYKTVVTVHDLTPLVFPRDFPSGKKGLIKWHIQKRTLKHSDAIITDSEASKKDIEKICGINSSKISVVYLAAGEPFKQLPNETREKIKEKYDLPNKFLLYVGDATANKNLPRLIKAVEQLDISLVMVGKTLAQETIDTTNAWNASLVETKKLILHTSRIKILGFVSDEDLVAIYNSATAFVMPSLYEGFGLPILEAMSCGCPVITTKEGSLKEVAGDAAYYVNAYDVEDIARGIEKVLSDETLQEQLREKGLEQVKKFTWEKTAEQTMQVYEKVYQTT